MYSIKIDEHGHDKVNSGHGIIRRKARKRIGYWGNAMPANLVNLDALIMREDFEEISSEAKSQQ